MQIAYNTISDWFAFFIRAKIVNYFMPCKFSFEFSDTEKQISYVVSLINRQKDIVSIKELATEVCLCLRQFEREFKFYTGYSPKEYSRIVKFWNAIHLFFCGYPSGIL